MTLGFIVGKFYPPHLGHMLLIRSGMEQCDRLVVAVCDNPGLAIPATLRAKWISDEFPGLDVRVMPDIGKDDDSRAWAEHTIQFLGHKPDVVFTSEDYGDTWARCMGSRHVKIDQARMRVPISGTKVRQDVFASWHYLVPGAKAHFARRVCVIGAESTGTTTMSEALARHYSTAWVPEFGRYHTMGKIHQGGQRWRSADFEFIADAQNRWEDNLAGEANRILICDTNSLATAIWHERYVGHRSEMVDAHSKNRRYDLYILTAVDIPFVQDGIRDGEHVRRKMHRMFEDELRKRGENFVVASGPHEDRLAQAIEHCDRLLGPMPIGQMS